MENKFWRNITIGVVALVALGILAFFTMVYTVQAGEVAVLFDPFADGVQEEEQMEGLHIKAPWVSVSYYNIKTQQYSMTSEEGSEITGGGESTRVVTNEGLYVDLDLTVLYRIDPAKASYLRQEVGLDGQYQEIIVRPTIRSVIRDVVSSYEAVEIYGDNRGAVQAEIEQALIDSLEPEGVLIQQFLLRKVELPSELVTSITAKKQAEQDALRMVYILQYAEQEKQRKIIEAEGIAAANEIIQESLTSEYLTWYWIENLQNHNSVVYLIDGESGLPIFKNVDEVE